MKHQVLWLPFVICCHKCVLRKLGAIIYHPLVTEIYTNAMTSEHKNIGRFHLTRVNLEFTDSIVNLIVLLELIRDGYNIKGSNFFTLNATIDDLLCCYWDMETMMLYYFHNNI